MSQEANGFEPDESTPSYSVSLRSILILFYICAYVFQALLLGFLTEMFYAFLKILGLSLCLMREPNCVLAVFRIHKLQTCFNRHAGVPLNVHPLCLEGKILSFSGHTT
jgi:hypothetical protein